MKQDKKFKYCSPSNIPKWDYTVEIAYCSDRHRGGKTTENGVPAQVSALANAVMAYAKNIDKIEAILPTVERICHRHICRGVAAVQYEAVGECLLAAMKVVLRDAATDRIMDAWRAGYENLAELFIKTEEQLRKELEASAGYSGFIEMVVVDAVEDEEGGKKLSIRPEDLAIPTHSDGQFVGIHIVEEGDTVTMATMKLTDVEKGEMWIFVPKSGEKASLYLQNEVSIGSVLKVSVPAGKALQPEQPEHQSQRDLC